VADLVVAGAGMAGLVAAAEAACRGARVLVYEKGDRPGGSMLLSSGVVWRHRELEDFRRECPGGDPVLQRLVHERLEVDKIVDAPNTLALFVWGPERVKLEYIEHKPTFSLT